MNFKVIKAEEKYLNQISRLLDNYRVFYKQDSNIEGSKSFLSERFNNKDSMIFIALEESTKSVVGFVQLYPTFSTVSLKRQWLLNDLFVDSSYRNYGVGDSLIKHVHNYFKDKAKGLILVTAKDNSKAKKLYEKNNWKTGLFDFYYNIF